MFHNELQFILKRVDMEKSLLRIQAFVNDAFAPIDGKDPNELEISTKLKKKKNQWKKRTDLILCHL